MSIQNLVQSFTLLTILFFSGSAFSATTTWEYNVQSYLITGDEQALTREFNSLGKDGWELVNCTESDASLICTFKRPVEEE